MSIAATQFAEIADRIPIPKKIAPKIPATVVEIQSRLKQHEREALFQRFGQVSDTPFDIKSQHPVLQEYYEYVKSFIDAKPQTIITSLLAPLASNIGNKAYVVAFGRNVYCNIWTIVMGPSSITRKTTTLEQPLGPLYAYDLQLGMESDAEQATFAKYPDAFKDGPPKERCHIYPSSTTERFIQLLAQNSNGLIWAGEIAAWLSKMGKTYNGDMKFEITEWYDSPEVKRYETMTRKGVLRRPCFSISMATTKEWLTQQLDPKDLHSGFMQRFLLCDSHHVERKDINCRIISGEQDMTKCNIWLEKLYAGLRSLGSEEKPIKLEFTVEALDLHEKINGNVLDQIFQEYNSILFSYWSRVLTGYFIRLCILLTLADHVDLCIKYQDDPAQELRPENLKITERTAAYALTLCQFYFQNIRAFLQKEGKEHTDTKSDQIKKKITNLYYEYAQEAGEERILTRTFIRAKTYTRDTKEFDAAIQDLCEMGVLQQKDSRNATGQKVTCYAMILTQRLTNE